MPLAAELPSDIAKLARCQYFRLDHRTIIHDAARLIAELTVLVPTFAATAQRVSGLVIPLSQGLRWPADLIPP